MVSMAKMRELRWIEIEIEDRDVDRQQKVDFCADLKEVLSVERRRFDVTFVEKLVIQRELVDEATS